MEMIRGFNRDRHYLGFKICDSSALESMDETFEKVKRSICSVESQYPEVHRTLFNRDFKYINLWTSHIGLQECRRLSDAFETFTEEHGYQLQGVKVKFTSLSCRTVGERIYVDLNLHPDDIGVLRELQEDVIANFREFRAIEFTEPCDLHCSLMYVTTADFTTKYVEEVVKCCSDAFGGLETTLETFILSYRREILCQYPESPSTPPECPDDVPAWVPRSLGIMWECINPAGCTDEESFGILRSIAELSSFHDFEDYMLDGEMWCYWEKNYFRKARTVAVFPSVRLRDKFYRYYTRRMAKSNWELFATDVIKDYPKNFRVNVHKILPVEKVSLQFAARRVCSRELPNYKSKVDTATLELYLQQLGEPYLKHYFETQDDLQRVIALLKDGRGKEYVSSIS